MVFTCKSALKLFENDKVDFYFTYKYRMNKELEDLIKKVKIKIFAFDEIGYIKKNLKGYYLKLVRDYNANNYCS